jgi:hypothetical protein
VTWSGRTWESAAAWLKAGDGFTPCLRRLTVGYSQIGARGRLRWLDIGQRSGAD